MTDLSCALGAPDDFDTAHWPASTPLPVLRLDGNGASRYLDDVVEEVPVALVYNGISHAVMLATPAELPDLALGFSLSEGILTHPAELYDLECRAGAGGIEVHLEIASSRFMALKERRRTLAGRTGCGLCGVDSLAAVARPLPPLRVRTAPLNTFAIGAALAEMPGLQRLWESTGAVHAAAWADPTGRILALREDVGRHNALDKLLGHLAQGSYDLASGFVLVSSRASYEMVQKTASQGLNCLVAVSAPSALAVRLAQDAGLTRAGFARGRRLVVYTHEERLQFSA